MKGREKMVLLLLSSLMSLNFVSFFSPLADRKRHDDLIV